MGFYFFFDERPRLTRLYFDGRNCPLVATGFAVEPTKSPYFPNNKGSSAVLKAGCSNDQGGVGTVVPKL